MSIVAQREDLFLLDVHVELDPLQDTPQPDSPFHFLTDATRYNACYLSGQPIEVDGFRLSPLGEEKPGVNHFWRYFGARRRPPDPWNRHLPFVHPHTETVDLVFRGFRAPVVARTLVWPWGWSGDLSCSLAADLDAESLVLLVSQQRSGDPSPGTFEVGGQLLKCNQVFRRLADEVRRHLFPDRSGAGSPPAVERHFVLSLPEVPGRAHPYESTSGLKRMKDSDRADLHSILLGRKLSIADLGRRERAQPTPFLLTRFTGTAFGLTDFGTGTVLYLPVLRAAGQEKDLTAKQCLAANVRTGSQMALGLAALLEEVASLPSASRPLRELAASGRANLVALSKPRANHFYSGFARHTRISKFLG